MSNQGKTVFVGLSGGVDSSVAALRLKQQGYHVVGVFIKVWQPEWLTCNWEAERLDAMRVAAKLRIPFLTCDAEAAYKQDVADYFIAEYEAGRTPNPDVMCNKYVKFGVFLKFAQSHGADYVATGHYAIRKEEEGGAYSLWRGADSNKDQSYFLWTLTQDQLAQVLLPVGSSSKRQIRDEANAHGLITAAKKDSQGICFLGQIDIKEFLSHYIDLIPGDVLNESGAVVGRHDGALIYTTGQRHGFTIIDQQTERSPHYVVDRNLVSNTITVAAKQPKQNPNSQLILEHCNFIDFTPTADQTLEIQTRYRQQPHQATIQSVDGETLTLTVTETSGAASIGQSCVLYRGDKCLGGGIIAQ